MIGFLDVWFRVLDETTTDVVSYFRQLNAYLSIDYTDIRAQVNPKLSKGE